MAHEHTQIGGDQPQWLGSLVRRGAQAAREHATLAPEDTTRWLGSVARREGGGAPSEMHADVSGWNGSSIRSAVFANTPRSVEPSAPPRVVHAVPANGHLVTGALGMTLRVAA